MGLIDYLNKHRRLIKMIKNGITRKDVFFKYLDKPWDVHFIYNNTVDYLYYKNILYSLDVAGRDKLWDLS